VNPPTPHFPPPARYGWIRPRWFLIGLAVGLGSLAWSGWKISRTDYHPGFTRFHSLISPEGNYYPTLDEMCAIVRAKCRPDQILVIVGGNSILLGVWQRGEDIWSKRLQELLGDRFCVINFAFRGGSPTDGGAVVAEALRREFPRQILIINEAPVTNVESFGHGPYRYIFWQAYFGGKLMDAAPREKQVREYLRDNPDQRLPVLETRISIWFDSALHYHDFWNWITFKYFGTVPSYREEYFPHFLRPRRVYPDPEVDGTDPVYLEHHYPVSALDAEMRIMRGLSAFYHREADGRWVLSERSTSDLAMYSNEAFPAPLKRRTLVLISGNSPYYRRLLTEGERAMVRQTFVDTVGIWRRVGYPAMDYGWDYNADDFGDRTHLTKLGGWKLAAQVAPEVSALAERLGYFR
jgi:hypothetical protein